MYELERALQNQFTFIANELGNELPTKVTIEKLGKIKKEILNTVSGPVTLESNTNMQRNGAFETVQTYRFGIPGSDEHASITIGYTLLDNREYYQVDHLNTNFGVEVDIHD